MHRDPDGAAPAPGADGEEPQWRHDFPIDWTQDEYVARRDFTKFLGLTSLAFVLGQFWILAQSMMGRGRNAGKVTEIRGARDLPVGGSLTFSYPDEYDDCILVRTGRESFVAYSQKCTHLSCPVRPDPENNALLCPCHHGSFDLATGRPTGGPPRRPLPLVELEVRGGKVYATAVKERLQ
ncbi:MAG TPA: Rieske 2Fe-2S domain-containing protein [Candidatus Kapabacteria bacterium]|nr:Rieske 2Fe-2S domain-containing protein [Candidatus Kapabacteria bacterium]